VTNRVDREQLRALFSAGIKLDVRASRAMHGRTKIPPLIIALFVYAMMSTVLAFALVGQNDPFVFSLFTISAAMFMTGLMVVMEYSTVVVNPDDFDIMAHRPISSKTYFWAKVGNLLFFVVVTAGALTLPAAIIGATMLAGPLFVPVYLAAGLSAAIAVAGLAVLLYSIALRIWSYDKFTSFITYLHTAATFVLVLGYVFLPRALAGDATVPYVQRGDWVFAAPPAWFAAATQLALGSGTAQDALLSLMALGATVAIILAAANTISLDYSRKLSELAASSRESETTRTAKGFVGPLRRLGLRLCRTDAERAGFTLLAAYMRRDKKLRARIFPAFGLPLAAYVAGLLVGEITDPLKSGGDSVGLLQILGFYSMFVGFFFASGITQSDQWKASWLFYAAPLGDRAQVLTGARKFVVTQFLIPFFVVLFVLLALVMPLWSAAAFVFVVFLLAMITFAVLSFATPNLPLSQSVERGRQARQIALMMVMGVFIGVLVAAQKAMQEGLGPGAVAVGALIVGAVTTESLVRRYLRRRLASEEYQG
jgi:ABC-2 type transport system permease protein